MHFYLMHEPGTAAWLAQLCWLIVVGVIVLLLWLWGEGSIRLGELAGLLLSVLGSALGTTAFLGTTAGWLSLALLLGLSGMTIHLALAGENRLFRAMLKAELSRLERRSREEPDNASIHGSLGEVCQRLRRYKPALRNYQRAAELEPQDPDYQHKVKQLEHILEAMSSGVRACPTCNAPVLRGEVTCPKCGGMVDEYLYMAQRFGRGQYLLVAVTALGTLLLIFGLGAVVGWRPRWLVGALLVSGSACLMIALLQRSRRAMGGG